PDTICRMAAYLSRKSRGCSATRRPARLRTPTNAGPAGRREKHVRPRNDSPRLSHPIGGNCRDDVRSAVDLTYKPPFRFTEQDKTLAPCRDGVAVLQRRRSGNASCVLHKI